MAACTCHPRAPPPPSPFRAAPAVAGASWQRHPCGRHHQCAQGEARCWEGRGETASAVFRRMAAWQDWREVGVLSPCCSGSDAAQRRRRGRTPSFPAPQITVQRPRPDFVPRCWPGGKPAWDKEDEFGGYPACSGDPHSVAEGLKSFPSGADRLVRRHHTCRWARTAAEPPSVWAGDAPPS